MSRNIKLDTLLLTVHQNLRNRMEVQKVLTQHSCDMGMNIHSFLVKTALNRKNISLLLCSCLRKCLFHQKV